MRSRPPSGVHRDSEDRRLWSVGQEEPTGACISPGPHCGAAGSSPPTTPPTLPLTWAPVLTPHPLLAAGHSQSDQLIQGCPDLALDVPAHPRFLHVAFSLQGLSTHVLSAWDTLPLRFPWLTASLCRQVLTSPSQRDPP